MAVAVPASLRVAVCVSAAVGGAVALPVPLSVGAADAPGKKVAVPLLVAVALAVAAPDAALDPVAPPDGEGAAAEGLPATLPLPAAVALPLPLPEGVGEGLGVPEGDAGQDTRCRVCDPVATMSSPLGSSTRPRGVHSRAAAPTP